ncbi:Protein argonaute 4 -like protein [Gossypium arboreum]|uniref:Protein argonaute 4-like protein n=1 Tax=Gossypium arboreum TaxID=29729 RepID=A0A0B0NTH3_GOSAR|nr:Protein argonaute 4 -like protein [Gossypium arboreum]
MLTLRQTPSIPVVSKVPTIILGMGTLFGSPEQSDVLSIAAMGSPDNVLHGIVIDNKVCHPKNNDSYLGTHAGMIGITRQTHYYVLLDQAGFLADDLQEFVYSLSYMYQRSTTAIFVVPPICYAHLATSQLGAIYED